MYLAINLLLTPTTFRFLIHEADLPILRAVPTYAANYGFPSITRPSPLAFLTPASPSLWRHDLEVRFAPGHAPGHVVFYHEPTETVIGGDVLFQESIGRTDLPGGNLIRLLRAFAPSCSPSPTQ